MQKYYELVIGGASQEIGLQPYDLFYARMSSMERSVFAWGVHEGVGYINSFYKMQRSRFSVC